MSVAEIEPPRGAPVIFGQIKIEDMRENELLTKTVMPLVAQACRHTRGKFTPSKVASGLLSGEYGLWGVMRRPASLDTVVVVRVTEDKVFELLALGPNFKPVFAFLPVLEKIALSRGCRALRLEGAASWRRDLGPGWTASPVVYERALEPR